MTPIQNSQPLCPHLAAAAIWASQRPRIRRNGKPRIYYARSLGGRAMDGLVAL